MRWVCVAESAIARASGDADAQAGFTRHVDSPPSHDTPSHTFFTLNHDLLDPIAVFAEHETDF